MPNTYIPYKSTGYFSTLMVDYLDRKDSVKNLYGNFPNLDGFQKQIEQKSEQFSLNSREILVSSLKKQYVDTKVSELTLDHIDSLKMPNSFTIVTGHQLNLFTGPLYFLYKIVSTLNLSKKLKEEFPEKNFVPVYWMATEDHDFEEINHFFVKSEKVSWEIESSGPVGRKRIQNFDKVFELFSEVLENRQSSKYLKDLFYNAYLKNNCLTEATRFLVNELFGEFGLVIVDGDDKVLKQEFIPYAKRELEDSYAKNATKSTNEFLESNYKLQVNPRDINLFYIENELRERVVFEDGVYKINNTDKTFTKEGIIKELECSPEKFSPNVIMRPLYQEVVLPNLCYIGGGGELAYWFQLKNLFNASEVVFPILLLRNSVMITSEKQGKKIEKLNLSYADLFLKQTALIEKVVRECCKLDLNLSKEKELLNNLFKGLKPIAEQTDISFLGALEAQQKKQLKGLQNLEKRLLKAEKRKYLDVTNRVKEIQDALFPRQGLQERNSNFAEFYEEYGASLIQSLLQELDPLRMDYTILEL